MNIAPQDIYAADDMAALKTRIEGIRTHRELIALYNGLEATYQALSAISCQPLHYGDTVMKVFNGSGEVLDGLSEQIAGLLETVFHRAADLRPVDQDAVEKRATIILRFHLMSQTDVHGLIAMAEHILPEHHSTRAA